MPKQEKHDTPDGVLLENSKLKAVFSKENGALIFLADKSSGWRIQNRPELGLSFNLLVPMPQRRSNYVRGRDQKLKSFKLAVDGKSLDLHWEDVESEFAGRLRISLHGTIAATDQGLLFTMEVSNHSGNVVECLSYPAIGDLSQPPGGEKMENYACGFTGLDKHDLLPFFTSHKGYFGVDYPTQSYFTPATPFVISTGTNEGLYIGCHETANKEMVGFTYELKPGYGLSHSENYGAIITDGKASSAPARVEMNAWHFSFVSPGENYKSSAILVSCFTGNWQHGVDIYKEWRKTWYHCPWEIAWLNEVHSWLQIQINCAEDNLLFPYKDLVQYARQCARHGVKALQLTGWNDGGQDRNNPSHNIDPRLGTWQDLKEAIAECEKLGVHIILFNKYTWADQSSEWFRNELIKYSVKNMYGDYHLHPGYQYHTPTQLYDISTRRLIPMCMMCPRWREIADAEFEKSIALGASGMLFDECQHHGGGKYCFDQNHGHPVPAFVYEGDAKLLKGFRAITTHKKPDYVFAGEACYDLEYPYYNLSYFRISATRHIAGQRYIDSNKAMMIAVTGFDDRLFPNAALRFKYIMSLEPCFFKGFIDDFPITLAYVEKIDNLRRKYKSYLWDGEFRDVLEATVILEEKSHPDYSVFRGKEGKRAVVICNNDEKQPIELQVTLDESNTPLMSVTPENPEPILYHGKVTVPALSVVVVLEQ